MLPELQQWDLALEALRARIATVFPEVRVSLSIQVVEAAGAIDDVEVVTIIGRDYSTPEAPIIFSAGEPFPGIPSIETWILWLASAPV